MPTKKHTVDKVETELEIDEDIHLHEKGWIAQRLGWALIFAIVVVAAFGLFGDGYASKKSLTSTDIQIKYDKYYRHEARMELKVDIAKTDSSQAIVSFPNTYLKKFRIESILPEPKENKVSANQVTYLFEGQGQMNLVFHLIPQEIGTVEGFIIVNSKQFPLTHFIYP